jgi:hypothetical protein
LVVGKEHGLHVETHGEKHEEGEKIDDVEFVEPQEFVVEFVVMELVEGMVGVGRKIAVEMIEV